MKNIDDFKFTRDFSKINWKSTLQLNLIRAAFAGPVIGIWALFGWDEGSLKLFFFYALLFPIMYLVGILPMALIFFWLSSIGVPFAGLFSRVLAFMVAIGDPFTAILARKYPNLVPVEKFGFFNLRPIIFVLYENELALLGSNDEEQSQRQPIKP